MRRSGILAAALLVATLTAAVAAPSLHYGFVYDDDAVVLKRPPFWELGFQQFLQSRPWGTGRHLTAVSLDLDRLEAGTVPLPFHLTNIALASLLSVLVLALALRVGLSLPAATAAAALFAVHPVHVDAVVWIVGRAELLAALGVVTAVLVSIRDDDERSRPWLVAAATTFFTFAAVHSKENALCVPLLLVVARVALGRRVAIVPALAGSAAALLAWGAMIGPSLGTFDKPQFVDNPLLYAPMLERVPKALDILWRYAALVAWPHPLLPDRSWRTTDPGLTQGWIATAAWAAATIAAWRVRRRAAIAVFAAAWFPAAFAITGNVATPIGILMAERLLLLPSVGLCLLAGSGFDAMATTRAKKASAIVAVSVAVAVLFVLFRSRASVWESNDTYFAASVAASPDSAKAWYDSGCWLLSKGDHLGAEAAFARALAIVPGLSRAASKRADSMAKRGDVTAGAEAYLAYLAVVPDDAGAVHNVTGLLLKSGRNREAVAWAQRLVELSPGDQAAMDVLVIVESAARREEAKTGAASASPPEKQP